VLTHLGRVTGDDTLLELLHACHQRIRRFAATAVALAAPAAAGRGDDEVAEAAAAVRRYFAVALPLHVEDEDLTLTPRLRGRDPAVDAALDRMHAEHRLHRVPLARLIALCAELAEHPERRAARAAELGPLAAELAESFERHLVLEESAVFPAVAGLPVADQDACRAELRARRQPA